nr:GNAT family N-acetyltransferase [Micromonospora sp. DSM 115978]
TGSRDVAGASAPAAASAPVAAAAPAATAGAAVRLRPLQAGDLGWILDRHAVLYLDEFGWGAPFEASVAEIVADVAAHTDDAGQRGWVAVTSGGRVGSIVCGRHDAQTARLRLLLVEPAARGLGVGKLLVDTCVDFARSAGYAGVVLTTQDALLPARRLYAAAGFRLVSASHEDSYDPAGLAETWHLDL